jgi:hypothetical protein
MKSPACADPPPSASTERETLRIFASPQGLFFIDPPLLDGRAQAVRYILIEKGEASSHQKLATIGENQWLNLSLSKLIENNEIMALGNWIIASVFLWLCGFLQLKVLDPTPNTKLIYTPEWIFILFGAPRHKDIPRTVLPFASVRFQTMGITMALYGILLDKRLVLDQHCHRLNCLVEYG